MAETMEQWQESDNCQMYGADHLETMTYVQKNKKIKKKILILFPLRKILPSIGQNLDPEFKLKIYRENFYMLTWSNRTYVCICYCRLIKCTCSTFGNASVRLVLCGTKFSDLVLNFPCPEAWPAGFNPSKHLVLPSSDHIDVHGSKQCFSAPSRSSLSPSQSTGPSNPPPSYTKKVY